MVAGIDVSTVRFDQPEYLWLLAIPACLMVGWSWQVGKRRGEARRFLERRALPVRERVPLFGGLLFWLCLILATASTIVAVARPRARASLVRTTGIDLVVLQDGSTSMRVTDVAGDRWRRSMKFLRLLGESLSWRDDRVALALFARIATPQIRLTKDPNTYFFFLDHLSDQSPFRLEDDTSWDTNVELGIFWGIRLIEKDQALHGRSPNAQAFVLISDGQSWSGEVERSLRLARARGIPLFAIGVGTSTGGFIPEPTAAELAAAQGSHFFPFRAAAPPPVPPHPAVFSTLDRRSLGAIAVTAGGQYFELDRETDRQIAGQIIDLTRRRASVQRVDETTEPLYWRFLLLAAVFVCTGPLVLHERAELWIQAAGAAGIFLFASRLIR
jgi:Ca-activated chloride channel family protein